MREGAMRMGNALELAHPVQYMRMFYVRIASAFACAWYMPGARMREVSLRCDHTDTYNHGQDLD
eukprot:6193068-Pleurochrysis_carterae.AAC.3